MRPFFTKLWNDPDYFHKSVILLVGFVITLIPMLPLSETAGSIGYWLKQFGLPALVAYAATARGSGLTADEAAKLRALIPTQAVMDAASSAKAKGG